MSSPVVVTARLHGRPLISATNTPAAIRQFRSDGPVQAQPTLVLPGGAAGDLGIVTPEGRDGLLPPVPSLPERLPALRGVYDNQQYPATYKFKAGGPVAQPSADAVTSAVTSLEGDRLTG